MEQFLLEHPRYSRGLLTFVLEYLVSRCWANNSLMNKMNTCDEECVRGQPCGCTCNVDPFEWEDDEVRVALHSKGGILG